MLLLNTTAGYQSSLASYCRTGNLNSIPGIKKENITHYRRLVINVVDDMLQNAFPLTFELLSAKEWKKAMNDFFAKHSCQSPQVWYMPKEFYEFIITTNHPLLDKYKFLGELLLFEWTEVEIFMMGDIQATYTSIGSLENSNLVINPEHQLLHFNYPVHKKNPKHITQTDKGNYYLVAHRNKEDEVVFTDASPAMVRVVEYLSECPYSLQELYSLFENEFKIKLSNADKIKITDFLKSAFQNQLLLGFEINLS